MAVSGGRASGGVKIALLAGPVGGRAWVSSSKGSIPIVLAVVVTLERLKSATKRLCEARSASDAD